MEASPKDAAARSGPMTLKKRVAEAMDFPEADRVPRVFNLFEVGFLRAWRERHGRISLEAVASPPRLRLISNKNCLTARGTGGNLHQLAVLVPAKGNRRRMRSSLVWRNGGHCAALFLNLEDQP